MDLSRFRSKAALIAWSKAKAKRRLDAITRARQTIDYTPDLRQIEESRERWEALKHEIGDDEDTDSKPRRPQR
jgi:hypothetical protein